MGDNIIFLCVILIILLIILLIYYLKLVLLYHPIKVDSERYPLFINKLERLTDSKENIIDKIIKTKDNVQLHTVYLKNLDSDKCIIFFHGNAGNLTMRFDMIKFLYNFASVIIFDYRSYGNSTGSLYNLSCDKLLLDAIAVWNYVVNQIGVCTNNISLFGESLGCSVAIYLGSYLTKEYNGKIYPHSIILNSPFYSLSAMIKEKLESFYVGFLSTFLNLIIGTEYNSQAQIKKINCQTKILIAHSPDDEIIPYIQGVDLYNSIDSNNKNKKFVQIKGTHNSLILNDSYMYSVAEIFS